MGEAWHQNESCKERQLLSTPHYLKTSHDFKSMQSEFWYENSNLELENIVCYSMYYMEKLILY